MVHCLFLKGGTKVGPLAPRQHMIILGPRGRELCGLRWCGSPTLFPNMLSFCGCMPRREFSRRIGFCSLISIVHCPMCGVVDESVGHIFFQCQVSLDIWSSIKTWLGLAHVMSSLPRALKWLQHQAKGFSWLSQVKRKALATTVYHIWEARNRAVF